MLERVRTRTRTRWVSPLPLWTRTQTQTPPLWTRTLVSWTRTRTPPGGHGFTVSPGESGEKYKANLNFHVQ